MRLSFPWPALSLCLAFVRISVASDPADGLLKLVPSDSGFTLAVEDLRGHAREIGGSPLFEGLGRVPIVKECLASEQFRAVERASKDIQALLGVSMDVLRDEVLGDAVILALQPGRPGKPDDSEGLLLVSPRDRSLIPRLIAAMNAAQTKAGELAEISSRPRGPLQYKMRRFKQGGRPPEFYIPFDDGTFAWSNSEAMIQGVIDRKLATGSGLGDVPAFRKLRRGLAERPLFSLFVNPKLLERAMGESSDPAKSSQDRPAAMLARYLGAVWQLGFAVQWRDGFVFHSHEVIAPDRLDPWLKRWLTRPASPAALPSQIPPSAVAVFSTNVDFEALRDAVWELIPDDDRPALDNFKTALQGILLGQDPLTQVLPRLASGVLLYCEIEPDTAGRTRFPWVAVAGWSDPPGADDLAAPVDNALRTFLAFFALDPKRKEAHLHVESRTVADHRVTMLTDGHEPVVAYRVDRDHLSLGTSLQAVARFAGGEPPSSLTAIRSNYLPEAETYAMIDVERLVGEVRKLREPIARKLAARSRRPVDSAQNDLGQLISLAELFKAATFTSAVSNDTSEIHRTIGLIAR